jgi:hypothetical protein
MDAGALDDGTENDRNGGEQQAGDAQDVQRPASSCATRSAAPSGEWPNLTAGTPVKVFGIAQADGTLKGYVLIYYTDMAPMGCAESPREYPAPTVTDRSGLFLCPTFLQLLANPELQRTATSNLPSSPTCRSSAHAHRADAST